MKALDIMTTQVVTVAPHVGVRHAVMLMLERNISALPVVTDEGVLVGIITEGDLMFRKEIGRTILTHTGNPLTEPVELEHYVKANAWRVGDVMTSQPIIAAEQTPVAAIAELMLAHRIKKVPIAANERLVGIISRRDILRALTFTDADVVPTGDDALYLAAKTRLKSDLGIEAETVEMSVADGVFSLQMGPLSDLQRRAVQCVIEGLSGTSLRHL